MPRPPPPKVSVETGRNLPNGCCCIGEPRGVERKRSVEVKPAVPSSARNTSGESPQTRFRAERGRLGRGCDRGGLDCPSDDPVAISKALTPEAVGIHAPVKPSTE